jgi:hypothetical protein
MSELVEDDENIQAEDYKTEIRNQSQISSI